MSSPSTPEPRKVLLIRHGETEWSRTDRHTGRSDIPLTARGERDAAGLAGITASLGLVDPFVIASPRARAQRTAALAGLVADDTTELVAEWDYGAYEGRTSVDIHANDDPDWTIWTGGGPGGESVADMTGRVARAVEVVESHLRGTSARDGTDVVIVSHGHFSRSFICGFLGWPIHFGAEIDLRPAGIALLIDLGSQRRLCRLDGPEGAMETINAL